MLIFFINLLRIADEETLPVVFCLPPPQKKLLNTFDFNSDINNFIELSNFVNRPTILPQVFSDLLVGHHMFDREIYK